jgi:TRAP-type C4-dicarboxylate transport system substrate-binding protein
MTKIQAALFATVLGFAIFAGAASPPPAAGPEAGAAASSSGSVVLKIASIAPARSPWGNALEKLANDWERISKGAVVVRIYPGGIAGGEQDMIRKMRLGILQGGVFSNMGLAKIDHDLVVLSIPFLFHSREEFNAVFQKMRPTFESGLDAGGFEVMFWTLAGWVNFFTKVPIEDPDDLKKLTIAVTADFPEIEQVWKRMGYEVVATNTDMMIQLQSGAVTAVYLPPLLAASGQFFPLVPNMLTPALAPLIGGLVLSDRAWASVPSELHGPFLEATVAAAKGLYDETVSLEADAVKMMEKNGLTVHEITPAAMVKWRAAAQTAVDSLIGTVFSKQVYDEVLGYLRDYRKTHGQ